MSKVPRVPNPIIVAAALEFSASKYGISYPGTSDVDVLARCDAVKAVSHVEQRFAAGHTGKTWVQLCVFVDGRWRVLAEWEPSRSRWSNPLVAAGYVANRCA